jgi:hypothetical protein
MGARAGMLRRRRWVREQECSRGADGCASRSAHEAQIGARSGVLTTELREESEREEYTDSSLK